MTMEKPKPNRAPLTTTANTLRRGVPDSMGKKMANGMMNAICAMANQAMRVEWSGRYRDSRTFSTMLVMPIDPAKPMAINGQGN